MNSNNLGIWRGGRLTPVHLNLKSNVLGSDTFQINLGKMGADWRRTIGLQWGYLVGTFTLTGDESELAGYLQNWLGYHIEERTRTITWEGIVVDLTLKSRVTRRRSLEGVWNRARVAVGNLVEYSGFETYTGGPAFWGWDETTSGGESISQETTDVASGTSAAKLTGAGTGTYIKQDITVTPLTTYRLTFMTRGDGSQAGQYKVRDITNASDIISVTSTGVTGSNYRKVTAEFSTKAACVSLRIILYVPSSSGTVYYDDVELRRLEEGQVADSYTDWNDLLESQSLYGIKEEILDGGEMGLTDAERLRDSLLYRNGWPKLERLSQAGSGDIATLEGIAIGYGLTTGWVFAQDKQYGSAVAAETIMSTLLAEAPYIDDVIVKTNTETVRLDMREKRLKQAIDEVVDRSGNGSYWRVYVTAGRVAVYEEIDFTAKYFLQDGEIKNTLNGAAVDPYLITPGIVRDVAYPRGADYPDSPYEDRRDFLMDEVMVENGSLDWSIGDF